MSGEAMAMRLALARLAVRHGVAPRPHIIPLADPIDGPLDIAGYASTADVDLDRVAFRRYAFCNPALLLPTYARPPLLNKHNEAQVAGTIDSLSYDEHGNVKVRCTVTHKQAKRCGAFSIRAKILAYELRETDSNNFHAVVTDAEIVEISLTDCPANPRALVQHRHRAAPMAAYLDAINTTNTLMIRRIEIVKQMAELLQKTCQRREPTPEPTRQRSSGDATPPAAVRVNPQPALMRRPLSDFTKSVRQLNNRGEASL
jgi:hypothetical protein